MESITSPRIRESALPVVKIGWWRQCCYSTLKADLQYVARIAHLSNYYNLFACKCAFCCHIINLNNVSVLPICGSIMQLHGVKSAEHVSYREECSEPKLYWCLRRTASPMDGARRQRDAYFAVKGNGKLLNLLLPDCCRGRQIFCQRCESWEKATSLGSGGVRRAVWAKQPQEHVGDVCFLLYSAALLLVSTCGSKRGDEPCFQGFVLFRVLWMRRGCFEAISHLHV